MADDMTDDRRTDDVDDEVWSEPVIDIGEGFLGPAPLAITAFVLAVSSVLGFGLMSGTTYIVPVLGSYENSSGRIIAGTVLGALLAMIPVWLGWRASSRLLDDDPAWVGALARAAVVIGLLSGALRLVVAVIDAVTSGPSGFTRL